MNLIEPDALLHRLEGAVLDHCEITPEGLHIEFEDGRILVLVAEAIICAVLQGKRELH